MHLVCTASNSGQLTAQVTTLAKGSGVMDKASFEYNTLSIGGYSVIGARAREALRGRVLHLT